MRAIMSNNNNNDIVYFIEFFNFNKLCLQKKMVKMYLFEARM